MNNNIERAILILIGRFEFQAPQQKLWVKFSDKANDGLIEKTLGSRL